MKEKENNARNTEIKQRQREHHGIDKHNENLHYTCFLGRECFLFIFVITIIGGGTGGAPGHRAPP